MISDPRERLARALEGRYRIERELGHGGMATVWLADDLKHGRSVAIKVMHPETAAAIGQDRFLREIEIAARLSHPHILPLFDSGAADGQLYYVMPHIVGESLRARLDAERQLPLEEALRYTREIASALGYAHVQGLVHRDVKPENILLSDDIALVADFGIAHVKGGLGHGTTASAPIGTPRYMSPEQLMSSADVDGRSDLYALACVLYEMLAGQPPFTGTAEGLAYQHTSVAPRPVTDFRPGTPPGIARVLDRALAKTPADRYATASKFAEALSVAVSAGATITPAPRPEGGVPNNLPRLRTRFIGRERELAQCAQLLGETRILTLTGVGGCGKTRLALRLAESMIASYPDGAWFVDLAPITDPAQVPDAAAAGLALRVDPHEPATAALGAHLARRRALLVFDNCEHVLSASAALADALLAAAPELRIVATSRESLGLDGERLVGVRSLGVPPAEREGDLEAVRASDAARLFVDRARAAEPAFELTAANAPAVASICRQLDGIPLALELAAARVRILSPEQILAKLDDRFRLLTGGAKTALPRHQTLRATIQWSYDALTPAEQHVLRSMGVFAGGWGLAAGAAVAGEDADEFAAMELLARLVDKSLVLVDREEGAEPRYRMLETVRQYAQERLNESGEGDAARTRHLEHFAALAEEAERSLQGPEQGAWIRRLAPELENFLTAHAWCDRAPGGAETGLTLVAGLRLFWNARGLVDLGWRQSREALARLGAGAPTLARGRALRAAARLSYSTGRYADGRERAEESRAIARELGDRPLLRDACYALALLAVGDGRADEAQRFFEETLGLARELEDRVGIAASLNGLGELRRAEGDFESARGYYQQSLANSRERGRKNDIIVDLVNLASVRIARRELDEARESLREVLDLAAELGTEDRAADALMVAVSLALASREWARGLRLEGALRAHSQRTGRRLDPADAKALAALAAEAEGALGAGACEAARDEGRALTLAAALGEVREGLELPS